MELVEGVGIGLRREHFADVSDCSRPIDFFEIIPENYVGVGGQHGSVLAQCRQRWPILAHGVSLSLGGPDPLNIDYIQHLKTLLDRLNISFYTDHLCYASIHGTAYHDLLPLPFTEEAVRHAAARIRELADRLERPVAVEKH